MNKKIILTALVFGFVSIILGAFGAHALKKVLTLEQLSSFEVGVKYMMYHALFLLFVSMTTFMEMKQKKVVFYLTLFGTILFSGSIFLLTSGTIIGLNFKFLGPITPIGGLLLIASWVITFYYIGIKKE
ncbi:DUF423 domain-containing protein [Flavobacterium psychrophilum]|uniref:DUF423 domain-containing protein n=2 Tax=Flavobacterium psychrophilum TaxID=96345 RepID=A6H255_FLAPJ|nr:DUF423 domain-containing protein [Flavobacterium psychrophilum]AIG31099.1 membrane protein [Flavobacterium psychrophilum]AIG33376.1 membrane protein [Flavobacterium psychrophilum]AIG35526.1 membrane protein [Flavobacterium psychrophilum]AIG37887.1 membrane protein [Flavobacterium psychrophilum]AIG40158.1 membrane protein [Flavobacterium psychrophilum]